MIPTDTQGISGSLELGNQKNIDGSRAGGQKVFVVPTIYMGTRKPVFGTTNPHPIKWIVGPNVYATSKAYNASVLPLNEIRERKVRQCC